MKISIIEPVGAHGGMNYYDAGLLSGLRSAGVHGKVFTCDSNVSAWENNPQVSFAFRGIFGSRNVILRALSYFVGLFRSLISAWQNGSTVIHVHLFHYGLKELMLCLLARMFCFKLVATIHDVESFVTGDVGAIKKLIFFLINRFVVHNDYSKSSLVHAASLDPAAVDIIPHGNYVDFVTNTDRESARKELGIKVDQKIILFFGQIKKVKALDVLIRSLPYVKSEIKNVTLLVAGKYWKNSESEYLRLIEELNLSSDIRLDIGYVPDDKVHYYYCAADVVALPYREIFQSGVLLMALSYARPVVVSNIPGMTDIIEHGENGLVFEPESASDLAAQLARILSDQALAARLESKGFDTVFNDHCWNKVGSLTRSTYEKTMV